MLNDLDIEDLVDSIEPGEYNCSVGVDMPYIPLIMSTHFDYATARYLGLDGVEYDCPHKAVLSYNRCRDPKDKLNIYSLVHAYLGINSIKCNSHEVIKLIIDLGLAKMINSNTIFWRPNG